METTTDTRCQRRMNRGATQCQKQATFRITYTRDDQQTLVCSGHVRAYRALEGYSWYIDRLAKEA